MKIWKIVCLLLIGLGCGGGAVYTGADIAYLKFKGLHTTGTVITQKTEPSGKKYLYYPVVRYQTADGLSFNYEETFGSSTPLYAVMEKVSVLYDADNPKDRVMIDRGWQNWLMPGLFGLMGVISLIIAAGAVCSRKNGDSSSGG